MQKDCPTYWNCMDDKVVLCPCFQWTCLEGWTKKELDRIYNDARGDQNDHDECIANGICTCE